MKIIITRPAEQAVGWVQSLRALGLHAEALPLIAISPPADAAAVRACWVRLADFGLVMFVSANAVQRFFAERPVDAAWPPHTLAGSTGPGSAAALAEAGVAAEHIVSPAADGSRFDSEALWSLLAARPWRGVRALVVRGEEGRDWLARRLSEAGAAVEFVAAYRRSAPVWGDAQRALLADALAQPAAHGWVFSSSESLQHLQALAPAADWSASRAWASHPRIADAVRALGFGSVTVLAPDPARLAAAVREAASGQGASIESPPL